MQRAKLWVQTLMGSLIKVFPEASIFLIWFFSSFHFFLYSFSFFLIFFLKFLPFLTKFCKKIFNFRRDLAYFCHVWPNLSQKSLDILAKNNPKFHNFLAKLFQTNLFAATNWFLANFTTCCKWKIFLAAFFSFQTIKIFAMKIPSFVSSYQRG